MPDQKITVVKIGGNIIDDNEKLKAFLHEFASLPGKKILVHGGGKMATAIAAKLGIETRMTDGRRITDEATLQVAVMTYAGWINKSIVAELNACNCPATGLSGADANLIPSKKRIRGEIDFGFVGDPERNKINISFLNLLLQNGYTPVIAPISCAAEGLMNTNADTIAAELALALSSAYEVKLVYGFEKKGVLKNISDENSVIENISSSEALQLQQDGIIDKGMMPKIAAAFEARNNGVGEVLIGDAMKLKEVLNGQEKSTRITENIPA